MTRTRTLAWTLLDRTFAERRRTARLKVLLDLADARRDTERAGRADTVRAQPHSHVPSPPPEE